MADEKTQGIPSGYPHMTQANAPYPGMLNPMGGYAPYYGQPQPQGQPPPYSYGYYPNQIPQQHQGPPPSYYPNLIPQMPMNYQQYASNIPNMPGMSGHHHSGAFDAGARFGPGGGQPLIPPPPPGYAPNAAQIAAMQGQPVVMDKKHNSFLHGAKSSWFG